MQSCDQAAVRSISLLLITAASHTTAATWTITQVTDDSFPDYMPRMSGGNVTWSGYCQRNKLKDTEIYFYDGTCATRVTDSS